MDVISCVLLVMIESTASRVVLIGIGSVKKVADTNTDFATTPTVAGDPQSECHRGLTTMVVAAQGAHGVDTLASCSCIVRIDLFCWSDDKSG